MIRLGLRLRLRLGLGLRLQLELRLRLGLSFSFSSRIRRNLSFKGHPCFHLGLSHLEVSFCPA